MYFMYKAQARKAFGFQARDMSMCSCVHCSFDLNVLKFKDQIAWVSFLFSAFGATFSGVGYLAVGPGILNRRQAKPQ